MANRRSTHSSRRIFTSGHHLHDLFLGLFEKVEHLFTGYGGEPIQEVVNRLAAFDVVNERLDWHPGSAKNRRATHHVLR